MRKAGLEEAQAGIKIAGRNILSIPVKIFYNLFIFKTNHLLNFLFYTGVWLITINWKILKEMGIPDHLTCLLRNLYAGQESTVRTGHGTTDWFQIGKGVHQGCILSLC